MNVLVLKLFHFNKNTTVLMRKRFKNVPVVRLLKSALKAIRLSTLSELCDTLPHYDEYNQNISINLNDNHHVLKYDLIHVVDTVDIKNGR